ncbi:unnamed protein product, partial [Prorocentrum cordatum]
VFNFQPRGGFKDEHGCLPDQAKAMTLRVTNAKGEDSFGVVALQDEAKPPTLRATTTRRLVRRIPILKPEKNFYKAQPNTLFENLPNDRARARGQTFGNKYQPKAKKFSAYSKKWIKAHVKKNFSKAKGLRRRVEGWGPEHDDDSMGDCSGDAGGPEDGGDNAAASAASSAAAAPAAAVAAASGHKTKAGIAPSVADSTGAQLGDSEGRLKPPEYWCAAVATSKAFASAALKKNVAWAKDCVARLATQGEAVAANYLSEHIAAVELSMQLMRDLGNDTYSFDDLKGALTELVDAKAGFDSNIRSKLLGKRLRSSVNAFGKEEFDETAICELASVMMPFKAGQRAADEDAVLEGTGVTELMTARAEEDFGPINVSMATLVGTMEYKFALLLTVLLKEIIPAVSSRQALRRKPKIPTAAVDALNVLRVMCALSDQTANVDFEVLEEFYAVRAKKTKGALADLGVVLQLNDQWKPLYEELHRTLQGAKE